MAGGTEKIEVLRNSCVLRSGGERERNLVVNLYELSKIGTQNNREVDVAAIANKGPTGPQPPVLQELKPPRPRPLDSEVNRQLLPALGSQFNVTDSGLVLGLERRRRRRHLSVQVGPIRDFRATPPRQGRHSRAAGRTPALRAIDVFGAAPLPGGSESHRVWMKDVVSCACRAARTGLPLFIRRPLGLLVWQLARWAGVHFRSLPIEQLEWLTCLQGPPSVLHDTPQK